MNINIMSGLVGLSLAALGCGSKALDLDAPAIEASNEPGVLGISHEQIDKIAVEDQRLYWIGHLQSPPSNDGNAWFVQSCKKDDCAATLVTYDAQPYRVDASTVPFSVQGGQIYWYRLASKELLACPVSGCNGSPRTVASELQFDLAAFANDRLYFAVRPVDDQNRQSLRSLSLAQPGAETVHVPVAEQVNGIAIDDPYVYWLESNGVLVRTRTDGASGIETVAKDVRYSWAHPFSVTTDATAIYWTDNLLSGSINRCPLAGCAASSEAVVTPLRAPQKLLLDGSELYYQYETKAYQYTLASCSLPACEKPLPLLEGLNETSFAVDAQYLYLATNEPVSDTTTVARIRRLAKPERELP